MKDANTQTTCDVKHLLVERVFTFDGLPFRVLGCSCGDGLYMEMGQLCAGYRCTGDPAELLDQMDEAWSCGEIHYSSDGNPADAILSLALLTGHDGDIGIIRRLSADCTLAVRFTEWIIHVVMPEYPSRKQFFDQYCVTEWLAERKALASGSNVVWGPWRP